MKQLFHDSWWARRDVLLMVGGKQLSAFGDAVLDVVLLLKVHDSGAGAFAVAALMLCEALPMVALMGLAGRVADSRDSLSVLLTTTALQALACCALLGTSQLGTLLVLVLVIQSAQTLSQATWAALSPRVVGEANIGRIVSLQQGLAALTLPLGATVGPLLLGILGADAAIAADAATFAVLTAAVLLIRTRRHVHPPIGERRGIRIDLLRRDPLIWSLVLGLLPVVVVLVAVNVLEVFLVRDDLGVDAKWYGLANVAWGIGAVAGSALAALIRDDVRRIRLGMTALGNAALVCALIGMSPNFAFYLIAGVGVGVANAVAVACLGTVIVTRVDDADRGKMSATVNGLLQTASLIGLPVGALIGGVLGTRTAIISAGLVAALAVFTSALRLKRVPTQRVQTDPTTV